jgi:hypothetical protein
VNPLLQGTEQTALPGRLNPFYLDGRTIPIVLPIAQQLGLRDGQIIQASIELRGETLKLLYNGELIDLPPGLRFRPGEQVWLRANRSAGGWTLKAIDTRAPVAANNAPLPPVDLEAAPQAGISRLLALSLRPPMSSPLLNLFQPGVMNGLLQSAGNPELASQFQRMQLSMRGLSPGALQGAVMSSGFWLEALLGRGQPSPAGDAKTLLRKLIRALGDKEPARVDGLNKAIDDIESAQVESLAAQARGELSFAMVLPFADANPVEVRFFRPARRPGQDKPPFSVDIHTTNDVLGEVWLKTSISQAAHVDLMMWAMKESVVRLAKRHSDGLSKRLSLAGLTMDSFRIFHSARPGVPDEWAAAPGSVLDVIA